MTLSIAQAKLSNFSGNAFPHLERPVGLLREIEVPAMLVINERLSIPLSEFQFDYARSGGPGGQNVNKVNSKVLLRWHPATSPSLPEAVRERLLILVANRLTTEGDLLITSQTSRDQSRNLADCLDKLRVIIIKAANPPKPRRPTRPTLGSKIRRVEDKSRRAKTKEGRKEPKAE